MLNRIVQASTILASILATGAASAGVISASNSWNGQGSVTVDGVTITAYEDMSGAPGVIGTREIPGTGIGAGVVGQGNNEIDWYQDGRGSDSEVLSFTFSTASVVDWLQLGLLFDGPEYGDFEESAGFTVTFADNSQQTYSLQTQYPGGYTWSGAGTWVSTGLDSGLAGLWTGFNPFGDKGVLRLDLFGIEGDCGTQTKCTDQSDYVFYSLKTTSVPEPGTLALLGLGLLGMGWITRRGRHSRQGA